LFICQGWPRKLSRTNVSGLSWTDRIVSPLQERTAISSVTTTRNKSSRPHGFKQQDCYLMDKLTKNWRWQPSGEDCRHETRGDSRVENWCRQPTREDCRCDHVRWRLPATDAWRLPAPPCRVKTAGTTRGDSQVENWRRLPTREDCRHDHIGFFCWCLWFDQGANGEVYFFFLIRGLPLLPL
jgi:hypothetical protein